MEDTRYDKKDSVIIDGNTTLRVNDVGSAQHRFVWFDCGMGGLHRVEYQLGTAISNQLSLRVYARQSLIALG